MVLLNTVSSRITAVLILVLLVLYSTTLVLSEDGEHSAPGNFAGPQGESDEDKPPAAPAYPATPPLPANFERDFKVANVPGLSGRIAFTARINGFDRILVYDLDARRIRRLIDGPGNNFYPSWSPDGTMLAFTSDRDGRKEIYVADWEGNNQRRLTHNPGDDDNASWSPDGEQIVYYSEPAGQQRNPTAEIFIISAKGGTPRRVTSFGGRNTTPRWSPDGSKIAYSTNRLWPGWSVCMLELASGEENCFLSGAQTYCRPTWSASGHSMAYSFGMFDNLNIGVHNFRNNSQRTVSSLNGRDYDVVWAPDDKWLAFVSDVGRKDHFNMFVRELDEGKTELEILSSPYSKRYLSWSGVKTLELEARRIRELQQTSVDDKDEALESGAATN